MFTFDTGLETASKERPNNSRQLTEEQFTSGLAQHLLFFVVAVHLNSENLPYFWSNGSIVELVDRQPQAY